MIQFFEASSVGFLDEETHFCKKLVKCVRDIFWYLDRRHHIFERINKPISSSFNCFVGYDVPQLSKHRKRVTRNLSSDKPLIFLQYFLRTTGIELAGVTSRSSFLSFLGAYSDYSIEKNKKTKANHRSPTPVRDLPENLHLKYLAPADEHVPAPLKAIDELLQNPFTADYNFCQLLIFCLMIR